MLQLLAGGLSNDPDAYPDVVGWARRETIIIDWGEQRLVSAAAVDGFQAALYDIVRQSNRELALEHLTLERAIHFGERKFGVNLRATLNADAALKVCN